MEEVPITPTTTTPVVTEAPALTKAQKKKLKEKAKKLAQKQGGAAATTAPAAAKTEEIDEDTRFQNQLDWCICQLELGLMRKDVDKDQAKESQSVINKLRSNKNTMVQKAHLMHVVFGSNLDKKIKSMPIPQSYIDAKLEKKRQEEEAKNPAPVVVNSEVDMGELTPKAEDIVSN
eukprot:gene15615-18555_t